MQIYFLSVSVVLNMVDYDVKYVDAFGQLVNSCTVRHLRAFRDRWNHIRFHSKGHILDTICCDCRLAAHLQESSLDRVPLVSCAIIIHKAALPWLRALSPLLFKIQFNDLRGGARAVGITE